MTAETKDASKVILNKSNIPLILIIFFTTLQIAIVGVLLFTVYDLKTKLLFLTQEKEITAQSLPLSTEKLPIEMRVKVIKDDTVLLIPK